MNWFMDGWMDWKKGGWMNGMMGGRNRLEEGRVDEWIDGRRDQIGRRKGG